jgi:hypothetical protein
VERKELHALASLIGLGAVFWWFSMRMLDGFAIVEQAPWKLFWVYIVTIVLSSIVAIAAGALTLGAKSFEDERDRAIALRAGRNERFFIIAAINVVVWQALAQDAFAAPWAPRIDFYSPAGLFFTLFVVLFRRRGRKARLHRRALSHAGGEGRRIMASSNAR